ncbi:LPS assembly lipoprotein LptE [Lewinella sp. IMCC34183]|uniref:LPS assembly lipoprotein LptE n=1 Tax=Lewinella sp. IMCC34183 TaxID=2248762 RepID=UPI000E27E16E|nr:LPS assembly lipoprotein LptE [Lewinella sp. IMCC34183]
MRLLTLYCLTLLLTACYTFRGISIPAGVERAFVPVFEDNALSAPPTLALDITESLRDKVRDEARLVVTEEDPDIELRGTLVDFQVTAEGASAGNETAAFAKQNRLTVVVAIEYTNLRDPDAENWRSNFTESFPFDGNQTLASVQDEAIAFILENLNEKIFNRAFADDW